ncbi:YciI family protein [Streptosporangium sp. NPDC023615]|uniref:YciI family protein n=1 Tax=Streptosporangium sp. NPDC023615 TaxID=3154794 RepID=UPI00344A8BD8
MPASPREVWEALTLHTSGWYWEIDYEPRAGGAERGLTGRGGVVSVWEPPRHLTTRTPPEADEFNELDYRLRHTPAGTLLNLTHRGVVTGDHDTRLAELDACRRHTELYYHSFGEYLRHFPGRLRGARLPRGAVRRRAPPFLRKGRVGMAGRGGAPPVRRGRGRGDRSAAVGRVAERCVHERAGGVMARYTVLIYERETSGGVADIPPEVMRAHEELPARIAGLGGRIVAGLALEQPGTATSVRGGLVTDGPFIETKEALAGVFVLEARDLDHALELARLTPVVDGGVEVRPLIGFDVLEQGN